MSTSRKLFNRDRFNEIEEDWNSPDPRGSLGWSIVRFGKESGARKVTLGQNDLTLAQGVVELSTGPDTTGRCSVTLGTNTIKLGYSTITQSWRLAVPLYNDFWNRSIIRVGIFDNVISPGDATNGVYFECDGLTHTSWIACSARGRFRTKVFTQAPLPDVNEFQTFDIRVNSDGTLATFLIGGSVVATIDTNLPVGANLDTGVSVKIEKTFGISSRTVLLDRFYQSILWNEGRL